MSASSREPVVLGSSILAGLQVLVAGSALADVLDPKIASFLALVVAALTAGWGAYARGLVTPVADVAARETPTGEAAEGAPVDVQPEPAERVVRDERGRYARDADGDGLPDA